jgi:hypothetical protein
MSPRLLRPRAAGGFDPRAISGLAVWFDAADSASVTLNSGNVAELRDKSGNGKHMAQSTAANQPAYVAAGQNGRSVIRSTNANAAHLRRQQAGGAVLQEDLSFLGATTHTVFVAARPTARTFSNYLCWAINPASGQAQRLQVTGPVPGGGYVLDSGGIGSGSRINTTGDAGVSPQIVAFRRNGNDYSSFLNGSANATSTATSPASITFTGTYSLFTWTNASGAPGDGAGGIYDGDLFEIIHYNRALTTEERQRIERYLGIKWGITVA